MSQELKNQLPSLGRWEITGTLTTRTELHIGDGRRDTSKALQKKLKGKTQASEDIQYSTVERDFRGLPQITGSTLRAALRRTMEAGGISKNTTQRLFGYQERAESGSEAADGAGGIIECHDSAFVDFVHTAPHDLGDDGAPVTEGLSHTVEDSNLTGDATDADTTSLASEQEPTTPESPPSPFHHDPPYWNSDRGTGIAAGVAIDRKTRTAREKKLFHTEFVPPLARFSVRITGDGFSEDEVSLILATLDRFNLEHNPLTLGASSDNGWGQLDWASEDVKTLDLEGLKKWFSDDCPAVGYNALQAIDAPAAEHLRKVAAATSLEPQSPRLHISLRLKFSGALLINDPSSVPLGAKADPDVPDTAPTKDHRGHAMASARSVRGVLNSWSGRILRTLGGDDVASDPTADPQSSLHTIDWQKHRDQSTEKSPLCLADWMFGASGWRSPVKISQFVDSEPIREEKREFVAIDRFTGSVSGGAKFDALTAWKPTLEGHITLDLARLKKARVMDETIGLWVLLIRDLLEGDLTFGANAAIGFGNCTGEITHIELAGSDLPGGLSPRHTDNPTLPDQDSTELTFLTACLDHLRLTIPSKETTNA